jgi:hypothetical protein
LVFIALQKLKEYLEPYVVQLLIGAVAFYILLRLLTITDHSPPTALAFVESSGLVSTILGLVLQLLPEALLLTAASVTAIVLQRVLALATARPGEQEPANDGERLLRAALYVVGTILWALLLTAVPSPLGYDTFSLTAEAIALVAVALAVARGGYARRKKKPELGGLQVSWRTYWALPWLAMGAGLLLLSHVALDRQLWLPPELITVPASIERIGLSAKAQTSRPENGGQVSGGAIEPQANEVGGQPQDSIVGYVLRADEEWTTILVERPRVLLRLDSSKIVDRTVCRLAARSLPPSALMQLLGGRYQDRDVTPPCQGLETDR